MYSLLPLIGVGPVASEGFLDGELVSLFWWMELDLVPLEGNIMSTSVLLDVYVFVMALDSLSLMFMVVLLFC